MIFWGPSSPQVGCEEIKSDIEDAIAKYNEVEGVVFCLARMISYCILIDDEILSFCMFVSCFVMP